MLLITKCFLDLNRTLYNGFFLRSIRYEGFSFTNNFRAAGCLIVASAAGSSCGLSTLYNFY